MFFRRFPKEGNFRKLLLSLVKEREKDEKITFMSRKITKTRQKIMFSYSFPRYSS